MTLWLAKIIFPFEIPAEWFMPKEKDKKTTKKRQKRQNYILWAVILFPSEISAEWFMSGSRQQRLLFPRDYTGKPEDKTFFHTGCTQINT